MYLVCIRLAEVIIRYQKESIQKKKFPTRFHEITLIYEKKEVKKYGIYSRREGPSV